ncbi:unnamed protein product [Rotaria sp. Silwood2]|nr:unnamed protein product [Rotaria sp. Silwood2]
MVKMGFFIRSLHRQLEYLHEEQAKLFDKKFIVYRGQGLSSDDFQQLFDTKGGLLSFNNFLSTSTKRKVAMDFANEALRKSLENIAVIFIMTIEPDAVSNENTPYAYIEEYSAVKTEQEILFSMHTVFRVVDIEQTAANKGRLWEVQLNLTADNDEQLVNLTATINDEIGGSGWSRMGHLMLKVGDFNQAEELYNELLKNSSSDNESQHIYHKLGLLENDQGKYQEAVSFYEQSLKIQRKTLPEDHSSLAPTYHMIGQVYNNMGDYSKALEYYEKAHKIFEKALPHNHPDLATSYINIGQVYKNMGDYSKALEYYERAHKIYEKALPPSHPDLASSFSCIGGVYSNMGDYSKALEYYEKGLKIFEKALPHNHPDLATSYINIGQC